MDRKKVGKKRKTVTFDPEPDVLQLIEKADLRGRGVRSKVINQAIRKMGPEILDRWDELWGNKNPELLSEEGAAQYLRISVPMLRKLEIPRIVGSGGEPAKYQMSHISNWLIEHQAGTDASGKLRNVANLPAIPGLERDANELISSLKIQSEPPQPKPLTDAPIVQTTGPSQAVEKRSKGRREIPGKVLK